MTDYAFANGVVGKIVIYHMEERERVKIVDYQGSKKSIASSSDEDRREAEENAASSLRLDSFLDEGSIRRVEGVLREYDGGEGLHQRRGQPQGRRRCAGGPKLVNVTFTISEGPKLKIRDIDFVGNQAFSDGTLQQKMKENKPKGMIS